MEASITFKSVAKVVNNNTLLAELTFGVEKNTTFVLVGPNGSFPNHLLPTAVPADPPYLK